MAVDMFIKIANIKGESKDGKHPGETDVLAWSWGVSQSGTMHVGGGGGAGKANVSDLSFTKWVDKGSPDLLKACCKGTHIKDAVLVVRKAGDKPLEYLTITMEEVLISSVSTGGSGGEDRLTENVTLNFAKVKFKYIEQTEKGGEGDKPDMAWNIQANEAY
ncbi:MAG: Hcp1 family type VI secretion system effector [Proteobacteria bacterium ST_bin11]|jgi:type VI secretion system secreted protein Hcp|nr:MAG: Hcp1 family type VI secretion system effector [Proteobacteria bacterium ST_bin11]